MPTTAFRTYSCQKLEAAQDPQDIRQMVVLMEPAGAGLTSELDRGTVLGQVTATGKFAAYSEIGADNGCRVARALLPYDISVDDAGKITLTETAGQSGNDKGFQASNIPVYIGGCFKSEDLTGMDANGLADLQGKLVAGDLSTGVIRF